MLVLAFTVVEVAATLSNELVFDTGVVVGVIVGVIVWDVIIGVIVE